MHINSRPTAPEPASPAALLRLLQSIIPCGVKRGEIEERALTSKRMASMKVERPAGSQTLFGQTKKEPSKASDGPAKAQASKPAAKKAEQKPREPKKKAKAGKTAAKN